MQPSPFIANQLHARTRALLRKREVPLTADGRPGVRMPPHDGVTLLRAAICLSVVVVHLQWMNAASFPPFLPFQPTVGWLVTHLRLGYESFFVLAGFFLAHSFRPGPWRTFSVGGFFGRRTVRLLLPYWLILIVSWVVWLASAIRHHDAPTWFPPGFWKQMFLLHNLEVGDLVAPQLWFMAPLMQFYLGWGIVFWLARKAWAGLGSGEDHRAAIRVMMGMLVPTFLVSIGVDDYRGGLDFTLLTNAHYLALGCVVYWYGNGRINIGWLLGALGLEIAHGLVANQSRPIAAGVTCVLLAYAAGRQFSAGPKLAWAMAIGRCSYSIYLTHLFVGWRVMALFSLVVGSRAGFRGEETVNWLVAVAGCVVFGFAYYLLVERPCAKWARAIEYRRSSDGSGKGTDALVGQGSP